MSEYARETGTGLEMTAIGFRNLYLLEGAIFEGFECPFCEIDLTGNNLYHEAIVKRPYFRTKPKKPHRYGCDGYPVGGRETKRRPGVEKLLEKYSFLPRDAWFPEELADVWPTGVRGPRKGKTATISESEVSERRRAISSATLSAGAFKSPTVRAFAETWKAIISACYAHTKITGQNPKDIINHVFSEIPLSLPENPATNYKDGIRSTKFIADLPCIYHGRGTVVEEDARFVIVSDVKTVLPRGRGEVEPYIIIGKPASDAITTKPHQQILQVLVNAATTNKACKWYAYGVMCQHENGKTTCQLKLNNLNWLYVYPA